MELGGASEQKKNVGRDRLTCATVVGGGWGPYGSRPLPAKPGHPANGTNSQPYSRRPHRTRSALAPPAAPGAGDSPCFVASGAVSLKRVLSGGKPMPGTLRADRDGEIRGRYPSGAKNRNVARGRYRSRTEILRAAIQPRLTKRRTLCRSRARCRLPASAASRQPRTIIRSGGFAFPNATVSNGQYRRARACAISRTSHKNFYARTGTVIRYATASAVDTRSRRRMRRNIRCAHQPVRQRSTVAADLPGSLPEDRFPARRRSRKAGAHGGFVVPGHRRRHGFNPRTTEGIAV
jgi:hypothetical protein